MGNASGIGHRASVAETAEGSLASRVFETPHGEMLAAACDDGLVLLEFRDRRALPTERRWLEKRFGCAIEPGDSPHLDTLERELAAYFEGEPVNFTTPLLLLGSAWQKAVWGALLEIPRGETRSYQQLAGSLGHPGASRAVGRANGENRIAILVPCHRVIAADGSLCGYGGGLERKRWLLEREGAVAHDLFGSQSV